MLEGNHYQDSMPIPGCTKPSQLKSNSRVVAIKAHPMAHSLEMALKNQHDVF
jgi:aryl-alcohol dehydrogenase-like predicted oxidoreductase